MDLRDYKVKPDEQLFDKIQHRLKVRRMRRIATASVAIVSVVAVATVIGVSVLTPSETEPKPVAVTEVPMATAVPSEAVEKTRNAEPKAVVVPKETTTKIKEDLEELLPVGTAIPQPVAEPVDGSVPVSTSKIATIPAVRQHSATKVEEQKEIAVEPIAEPSNENKPPVPAQATSPTVTPLWAPNAIVPDGDRDENRYFKLVSASPITEFTVRIFNRRGVQVYSSNDPNFRWNGTHNGARVPQGAYVWTVKYRDSDGVAQQQRGTVIVVR